MSRRQRNVLNMTGNGRTLCTVISGRNSVTTAPEIEQYTWDVEQAVPQPPTPTSLPAPGSSKSSPFDDDSDSGSNTRQNTMGDT